MGKTEYKEKIYRGGALSLRLPALLLLLCLSWAFFTPADCRGDLGDLLQIPDKIVPERDVALNGDRSVAWKKAWDQARYLVRAGDFRTAEKKYEELLALKNNIEQARWEYARVLLKIDKWEKAATALELLVEQEPQRADYLTALGLVSRKSGQLSRALDLFGRAYERNPADLTALAGLAQGLVEVGRKKEAFPLLREIFKRRPDDLSLQRALANLAYELGKMETARKLMLPLAGKKEADLDTLLMTARIYDQLKNGKRAAVYWQRGLKHDPGNREAHGRLALYYEKLGNSGLAMPHLLALLEKDPENPSLLSRICRIYIQSDRFAEALPYFEKYVSLHPDNLDVLMPVGGLGKGEAGSDIISLYRRLLAVTPDDIEMLDALAKDLLKVGNAETALFMWEHVARLYPDRVEVYQEIVDLLEKLGRDERLAEILEILHRLAPGEIKVVSKLAGLKAAQGDLQTGLDYYDKLEKVGYRGEDLFEGRAGVYEDLGRSAEALADYKRLLSLHSGRLDIRRRCIILAGKLGENLFLKEQVAILEAANEAESRDKDLLLAARAFAGAHEFEEALDRFNLLIYSRNEPDVPETGGIEALGPLAMQAKLELADLYLDEGLIFKAEQLLREMFLAGELEKKVVKRLFDLAVDNHRQEEAKVWLERYTLVGGDSGESVLMRARFLAADDDFQEAEDLLERSLYERVTGKESLSGEDPKGGVAHRAGLLLAQIFFKAGDLEKAEQQGLAMLDGDSNREVLVVLQKIYRGAGRQEAANRISRQLLNGATDSQELLSLAELFRSRGLTKSQIGAAEKALKEAPNSLYAAFLLADGWAQISRTRESVKLLEDTAKIHPGNSSIIIRMARYYYFNGQYALALQHCDRFLERNPDRMDAQFLKTQCVVALDDQSYAEKALKRLFPVTTEDLLEKNAAAAGIKLTRLPLRRTLLQLLIFNEGTQPSVADKVMNARHLVDNSSEGKKKLNFIAVKLYDRYRWESAFRRIVDD